MIHVGPDSKIVSLYVPKALDEKVQALADEQRRSKSQMVTLLIEQALNVAAPVKV